MWQGGIIYILAPSIEYPCAKTMKNAIRKEIVKRRRHIAKELLYGRAANYMIAKLSKGSNHKKLEKILVDHLYALKVNKFRLAFMEMEDKMEQTNRTKKDSNKQTKNDETESGADASDGASKTKRVGGFMAKNRTKRPALKKDKKG